MRASFDDIMREAFLYPPLTAGIVHPCDVVSLRSLVQASRLKLLAACLIGPEKKIVALAKANKISLKQFTLINAPHSHAAAEIGVDLAKKGEVEALVKGSLHTDELMAAAVAHGSGLQTARRMSHVFIVQLANYPKFLFISDAALNIDPSLEEKRDIVQNAIDLACALGVKNPKVAILSAVETVTSKLRSTMDAAALCKMADRGQITGGIIDGPLAFDNAISIEAAKAKHIKSAVAGKADILIVPNIEAGNILAKNLDYFSKGQHAGIVLGARVPIVVTSRADTLQERIVSYAVAKILAHKNIAQSW